ncbi:Retrovirus-related Pol polyprotein from transposon 17.6 [Gossypium australe]|uniref:Retrovirus-related Pol polyprotein from transposon 17.6 n=1 Tax=Gossypium australe TaxID=47621 RepID=A0A5B6W8C3_9ROSI|nr:Retrovirus-related Pol polyprotein from transposon 17.6 [Gossypium australe]
MQVHEDQMRLKASVKQLKEKEKNKIVKEKKENEKEKKKSEIRKALLTRQTVLVLIYKETLFNTNELPEALPSSDFQDVFPEETPSGLPPLHRIEHQIDSVPGAVILNRPAYRTNLEETKELQRQVNELMEKGYI